MVSEKTLNRAKEYYLGMEYEVTDADVLNFGRKYNPKILSLSMDDRANSVFTYVIQVVRISHVEDVLWIRPKLPMSPRSTICC